MLRLTASDLYTYFRPSKCEVRIYLKSIGIEEGPPGPFDRKFSISYGLSKSTGFRILLKGDINPAI